MSRHSQMIPIRADALKEAIKKRGAISSLTEQLGVSKQAISNWLSHEKISASHLRIIADSLNFSGEEIKKIHVKAPQHELLFRTSRNTVATDADKEALNPIIDAYLALALSGLKGGPKKSEIILQTQDPAEAAKAILKQIELTDDDGVVSLGLLIKKLLALNIHVLFLDFEKILPRERAKKTSRPRAFCASRNGLNIIVIDSNEKLDDMTWLVIHELVHVLFGHLKDGSGANNDDREIFCNETASEVQNPSWFYSENLADLKEQFTCDNQQMVFLVDDLAARLNSSFAGTLMALRKHKIISEQRATYLWAVTNRRANQQIRLVSLCPTDAKGWIDSLATRDLRKYFKAQNRFKRGLLEGKVSLDLAASVFGLDEHGMNELLGMWRQEYAESDPA